MPDAELPTITPWLRRGFLRYTRRYVRKHFHAVRLLRGAEPEAPAGVPLIVVLNHASWWDPLACFFLHDRFRAFNGRDHYAPMDAAMLERYRVFRRLGFFGIEADSPRGARDFLRTGGALLNQDGPSTRGLWVTAHGRFTDPRQRPVELQPGVAHLAQRLARDGRHDAVVLPLAIEYPFWDQRTPELLLAFGPAVRLDDPSVTLEQRHDAITTALRDTMNHLASAATARDPQQFTDLTAGTVGVGGLYDAARRLRAAVTGKPFRAEHGE